MRVRMIKTAAGPDGVWPAGSLQTMSDGAGAALLGDDAAIEVDAQGRPVRARAEQAIAVPGEVATEIDEEWAPGGDVAATPARRGRKRT